MSDLINDAENLPLNSSGSSNTTNTQDSSEADICRVCRSEASPDKPLFYPCVCTGSIKYIHQDCLVQWLKYSKKEYCELCKHKFSFAPIYHPDMPKRLPIRDIITGLFKNIFKAIKFWLHSTLVAISWLGIVPLTASRIYRCLFTGSVSSLLTLPLDMLSTDNIVSDIFQGGFVVLCSLGAFISLVWLREQILSGGGPDWLENPINANNGANGEVRVDNNNGAPALVGVNNVNDVNLPNDGILEQDNNNGDVNENQNLGVNEEAAGQHQNNNAVVVPQIHQQPQQAPDVWNPMEWDRAAEDLTWDRLLGLDGSLLFLEHVFWVISLNTLFILVFAFCPYHMGHYIIYGFQLQEYIEKTHFQGLITTLVGYVLFALILVISYFIMSLSSFHRARKIVGLCYIVIKVALLVVIEICVFPLICGIWLDVCSLKLFNSTINDRIHNFQMTSGTSVFIHWLIGMVYVFYFATFVFLLREVLRPGVLWFLRNLNDPDFNPIQEMILLPVYRHIKRFVTSVVLFGFSVVLMLFLPIKFVNFISSSFFPYNVSHNSETLASELSIELLWLHVVLPALLEQSHMRTWIRNIVRLWALVISWLLGIKSFLLGDDLNERNKNTRNNDENIQNNGVVIAAGNNQINAAIGPLQQQVQQQNPFHFNAGLAHQELLQNNGPIINQSYSKPTHFKIRIALLILMICLSLFISSIIVLVVPVSLGRWLLYLLSGSTKLHELYTLFAGLYTIWLSIRFGTLTYNWIQMGVVELIMIFKKKFFIFAKSIIALSMVFGIIPLLFGLLFQQIIINPLCCNHDQTPVISIWQVWALGVLHTKILTAVALTGPQWWLKQAIERICQDGLRNIDLKFITINLFYPVASGLGLALSIPYIISRSLAPLIINKFEILNLLERRIYPLSLFLFLFIGFLIFQFKQFRRLYERIRNDKYLVGQRLINFERASSFQNASSSALAITNTNN